MSHTYPISESAAAALSDNQQVARTRYEAESLAGDREIEKLATEWITPEAETLEDLLARIEAAPAQGFVQRYEDAEGRPVLAVTYWKLGKAHSSKVRTLPPGPEKAADAADDTDDLYFKAPSGRRKRSSAPDPNQLDLFGKPTKEG